MASKACLESEGYGQDSDADVEVITPDSFVKRPTRLQGMKAAKDELAMHQRMDATLRAQAWATKQMVQANLHKTNAMQDHATLSFFTMPNKNGLFN